MFKDNSKLCHNRNSIASHRNCSKTIPKCLLAKIQLHSIEIILTHPISVLAEIQLHLIDIILRHFQIVS